MTVNILPAEAVADGAQWRITGGEWKGSGASESSLADGTYTVEFKVVSNWDEPNDLTVEIIGGDPVIREGTYVRHVGFLHVAFAAEPGTWNHLEC